MKEFNELQSTNEYLTGELILARQANEIMTENNRRLERLLIKAIRDLQDADRLMTALTNSVNDLTTLVSNKFVNR
jgi:galactokinase